MKVIANLELCPDCAVDLESGQMVMLGVHVTDHRDFGRITCDACSAQWLGEYWDAVELAA